MAALPAFKPSGQGGQVDLKNVIKSQIIAWGGYKGQLRRKYTKLAGVSNVNGHNVFNDLSIMYEVSNPQSEVYKFMKFMGFDKETLLELSTKYLDNKDDIENIKLKWTNNFTAEEEDWEFWSKHLEEEFKKFEYFTIITKTRVYNTTVSGYVKGTKSPVSIKSLGININTEDNTIYADDLTEIGAVEPDFNTWDPNMDTINPTRVSKQSEVYIYSGGVNIASQFGNSFKRLLLTLAILEPWIVPSIDLRATYGTEYRPPLNPSDGSDPDDEWESVYSQETFKLNGNFAQNIKNSHMSWTTSYSQRYSWDIEASQEQKDSRVPNKTQTRWFWINMRFGLQLDTYALTGGLFMSRPIEPIFDYQTGEDLSTADNKISEAEYIQKDGTTVELGEPAMSVYMVRDNLMKEKPDHFGYFVSKFLDIYIKPKKGGKVSRFFGGLMRAFASLIEAITGIFLKIPVLKQFTEILLTVIGKVFGVDEKGSIQILNQIIMAVIVIIITIYTGGAAASGVSATSGAAVGAGLSTGLLSGVMTLVHYSGYAIQIYNAAMTGKSLARKAEEQEEEQDLADKKYLEDKGKKAVNDALLGTMGTKEQHEQSDALMYDVMFNPFYYFKQAIEPEDKIQ